MASNDLCIGRSLHVCITFSFRLLCVLCDRCRLQDVECMEDGLDGDVDWPAMPATAVLMLAALDLQAAEKHSRHD